MELEVFTQRNKGFYIYGTEDALGNPFVFPQTETKNRGIRLGGFFNEYPPLDKASYFSSADTSQSVAFDTWALYLMYDVLEIDGLPDNPVLLGQINNSEVGPIRWTFASSGLFVKGIAFS